VDILLNLMLREIDTGIWVTEAPQKFLGAEVGTRMTVIRLADGSLFVHSPVHLDDEIRATLDRIGPVRHVVAPNRYHHLYAADYSQSYREAKLYAAPGLETKRSDLHFDAILSDEAPEAWRGQIDQLVFRGFSPLNETVFFHRASRTVLFTDLLFNLTHTDSAWTRVVMTLDGGFGRPAVARTFRLLMKMRKQAVMDSVARIVNWDFDRITLAHGDVVERGAKPVLQAAYSFL
jgi:Domain of unknown function (DUF4336)